MQSNKRKNDEKKYSDILYNSTFQYMLVFIIFIGGSLALIGFMLNDLFADEDAPSLKEISIETADLLETYPEFSDWERKDDLGIALWLPKTFEQYQVDDVLDMANDDVNDIPYPLSNNIEVYVAAPARLRFLAFDKSTYFTDYVRYIQIISFVGREELFDDFVSDLVSESSDLKVIQEPTDFQIGRFSGKSIITERDIGFRSFATISYFLPHNRQYYIIVMQTSINQVDESKAMMEKVMDTLWIYNE